MTVPRRPFSWEGDDDPVPLHHSPSGPGPGVPADIADEAETVVRDAQEEMARQDTDPYMTVPPEVIAPPAGEEFSGSGLRHHLDRSLSRRGLATLAVVTCLFAFAHGWVTGASASPGSTGSACDADHCRTHSTTKD